MERTSQDEPSLPGVEPSEGLPQPLLTVDSSSTLRARHCPHRAWNPRSGGPSGASWTMENPGNRGAEEAKEETGLDVEDLVQFHAYSDRP